MKLVLFALIYPALATLLTVALCEVAYFLWRKTQ
jgi:hypothetical protein